jgi:glycosyltransferase involved in cell wall biosynthesis
MGGLRIAVYHNLHSGGAKRTVSEHIRRLASNHIVELFSLRHADHSFAQQNDTNSIKTTLFDFQALPWLTSPFGRLNPLLNIVDLKRLNDIAQETAKQIDDQNFDVVLVHPCQVTQTPLMLAWLRTPSLYYCHELPRRYYEPSIARPYQKRSQLRQAIDRVDILQPIFSTLMRHLDRRSARHATRIITNSRFTSTNASAIYRRNIDVCYQGVDTHAFQPSQAARENFVLSVGALTPTKGFDFVINALGTITSAERPSLVIISNYQEPQELQYLQSLASQQGVQLECLARVSEEELQNYYARAGCVAYAPVREPFGFVALEAMATGIPLVGVAEGGVAETVIDGETGLLTPRDPVLFGKALQKLIENPEQAEQLGQAARRYVLEHWTWDKHIVHLEQFLYETAGKRQPPLENSSQPVGF